MDRWYPVLPYIEESNYFKKNKIDLKLLSIVFKNAFLHVITDSEDFYLLKDSDDLGNMYMKKITFKEIIEILNSHYITNKGQKFNLKDIYLKYFSKSEELIIRNYSFYSEDKNIFSIFQGYWLYDDMGVISIDMNLISPLLEYIDQFKELKKMISNCFKNPNYKSSEYIVIYGDYEDFKLFKTILYYFFTPYIAFKKDKIEYKIVGIFEESDIKNMNEISQSINSIFYCGSDKIDNIYCQHIDKINYNLPEIFNLNIFELNSDIYQMIFKFLSSSNL